MNATARQMQRYLAVAVLGMAVDVGGTLLCRDLTEAGPLAQRVPAFTLAVLVTWVLHSRYTFQAPRLQPRRLPLYVATVLIGAVINLGAYVAVVMVAGDSAGVAVLAIGVGAGASIGWNFAASRTVLVARSPS